MASSVAITPSFRPFPRLPYELRLAIIEEYLKGLGHTKLSPGNSRQSALDHRIITAFQRHGPPRPLARYATINRQWKSVVEKHTFHTLALRVGGINDPNVLDDLKRICVGDRIDEVSEIYLSITVDVIGRYSGSASERTNAATDQGSRATTDGDTEPSIVHAERVATAALGHFFRIVAGWARNKEPLIFKCKFVCQESMSRLLNASVTRLAIDSSSFPEVLCLGTLWMPEGSFWGTQPESTFQLLTKLPNVKSSDMTFDDNHTSSDIKVGQEGSSTPSFLGSKLNTLCLGHSTWRRKFYDPSLSMNPSLQRTQSIFAMTSRLEEIYIDEGVVNISAFLRQACIVSGDMPQSKPAWPNLRVLSAEGSSSSSPSDDPAVAAEFYDSVTEALPHMPNIHCFQVTLTSTHINKRLYRNYAAVMIGVPPRDDRSAMPDGTLDLYGAEPDEYTVDAWQKIAQRHWHCKLDRVAF